MAISEQHSQRQAAKEETCKYAPEAARAMRNRDPVRQLHAAIDRLHNMLMDPDFCRASQHAVNK